MQIENPKDSTKKLLELINKFTKVSGYKINIQKSVAFLHVDNKLRERKVKKTIPFTISSKIIKYLKINLTKNVKDLYSENYDTLMKEIEEDTNKWKHIRVHGQEELTSFKCPYCPKQSIDSMQFLSRFQ